MDDVPSRRSSPRGRVEGVARHEGPTENGVPGGHQRRLTAAPLMRRQADHPDPAAADMGAPSPAAIKSLQRRAGNRAVQALMLSRSLPSAQGSTSQAVVARDAEPDVGAAAYADTFTDEIGNGVRDFIAEQKFTLSPAFMSWSAPKNLGTRALESAGASGGRALTARLPELIRPAELKTLVNRGRKKGTVQVTDDKTTWTEEQPDQGPSKWFPDVAVEIGQVLAQHFVQSIERIAPRYLDARVATVVEFELQRQVSLLDAPEPGGSGIIPSQPIDALTIGALTSGDVRFDWPAYRSANPVATGRKGVLRQVCFGVEKPQNGTYWVRVTSPNDPTVEEVAFALFGSPTMAGEIGVSAPPLFGFGNATHLRPEVRATLVSAGVDLTRSGDPAAEGMRGPLADEIALGQVKAVTGADKDEVLGTMDQSLVILDRFAEIGSAFGIGKDPTLGDVTDIRQRLLDKQRELKAAGEDTVGKWAGQVAEQKRILTQAAFGFAGLVERFQSMTKNIEDATQKLGGFTLPPYLRTAMHRVAAQYIDAARVSFFPAVGAQRLEAADEANRLLPVEILEATLAAIQRTVDDALADKRKEDSPHASYGVPGMGEREVALRARLARLRTTLLSDPMSAGEALQQLQQEILDLQTEAEMVGNMDQLDLAWQALDDSLSFWFSTIGTSMKVGALKKEGDGWHARWNQIFNLWKKGDKASRDQAKKDLDQLRKDASLADYFGRLKSTVKDAQTEVLIGKIVAMLVITIVTMGVGEFVIGAGATLLTVSGAEALTFTVLSQILLETDHSAGHIAGELATNWLMFGAMRRFAAYGEAAKLSKVTAASGQAVLIGAMGLAKEEIEKYIKTGKHLTKAEIGGIALQSLIMFVALQGVGHLAKPIMTGLRAEGTMLALRRNAANRAGEGLKAMAEGLAGSRDTAKALKYIDAERTWLELKIKAYEELELAATAEAKAGKPPKDGGVLKQAGMTMQDIQAMKATLGKSAATLTAARTMLTLDPIAPDVYSCPKEQIAGVLKDLGGSTGVTENPVTKVKTYEAKGPDGRKVRIVEALDRYERWLHELKAELTEAELAKLAKMSSGKTPREFHDESNGDKGTAVQRIRKALAQENAGKAVLEASKVRIEELKLIVADKKLMQDQEISVLVKGMTAKNRATVVEKVRDKVMAKIVAQEVLAKAKADHPKAEERSGIKIYEKQPETTVKEWLDNHPVKPGDDPHKAGAGLAPRPDGLYMQRGEIDLMIIVPKPGAKAEIIYREEIKTGTRDTGADAQDQLDNATRLLAAGGSGKIRLEMDGKDITGEIDLASDAGATKATRGPAGKPGFDESLGATAGDLERLVKDLLKAETVKPPAGGDTK